MTTTALLAQVKARLAAATRTEYVAHVTDKDCIDDQDLMRSTHRKSFDNETEAKDYASQFKHKKRPDYWQPTVTRVDHNDSIHLAPTDLAKLLAIVEAMQAALEQISGEHPNFMCDDHTDCEWTARGALLAADKLASDE